MRNSLKPFGGILLITFAAVALAWALGGCHSDQSGAQPEAKSGPLEKMLAGIRN